MAARALAASRNVCTTLILYFDLEQYTKASPEMKSAIQALENVRAGGCKCGNARPLKRYMGCGKHLACEECHLDFAKVANRKGLCNFPGCNCQVLWPCRPCEAFDDVQDAAKDAFQKLDHALQLEEHKDLGEGARRRAAALGRVEEPADADLSDPEDDVPLSEMAARVARELTPPPAVRRAKRKADYSTEEWQERKEARKVRAAQRVEDAKKLNEYDDLERELHRLQELLDANSIAY